MTDKEVTAIMERTLLKAHRLFNATAAIVKIDKHWRFMLGTSQTLGQNESFDKLLEEVELSLDKEIEKRVQSWVASLETLTGKTWAPVENVSK